MPMPPLVLTRLMWWTQMLFNSKHRVGARSASFVEVGPAQRLPVVDVPLEKLSMNRWLSCACRLCRCWCCSTRI